MRQWVAAAFVLTFIGLSSYVRAEDKPNPTGTWKWSVKMGEQSREFSLKLKLDGDKFRVDAGRDGKETPIADGKYKDGELSFSITREREGRKMTSKSSGKISGDTIKGKVKSPVRGKPGVGTGKPNSPRTDATLFT